MHRLWFSDCEAGSLCQKLWGEHETYHHQRGCDSMVYLVPDEVADQLDKYCLSFCDTWLHTNPDAEPYRMGSVVSYDEKDFIKYLNTWVFPEQPSVFIENIGQVESDADIPESIGNALYFSFNRVINSHWKGRVRLCCLWV